MGRSNQISLRWDWLGAVMVAVLVYACANRGYPEGGTKDTTPPIVVAEVPVSFTKNFNKKRVDVYFNEFVQLKEMNEKFIISPPMKKKPKVRLKGKYIQVDLTDTLKANTTYSLDFADAIADNNEGNPLGFYRYVFSTGQTIDSLEVSGRVVNAESNESMMNVYVELYANQADSMPLLRQPDYVARTDSSGFFRLTNLRDTSYRIVAIEDNNKDYKYTPESEMFAFSDTVVRPIVMPLVRTDTFKRIDKIVGKDTITSDSVVTTDYLAYGPSNLYLRIFQEKLTQLYMVDDSRKVRERLDFIFSIPGENKLQVRLWDTLSTQPEPQNWYLTEHSAGNDTLSLWIRDSSVYKKDTLNVILTYLRSDSTGRHVSFSDTTRYTFKDKKKVEPKGKKKDEHKEVALEFLDMKSNVSGEMDLEGRLWFDFDSPTNTDGLDSLRVLLKVDTLFQPVAFALREDSLKIRRIYVDVPWKAGGEYRLELDSARVYDLYGKFNNKYEKSIKVRTEEFYGNVILTVKGVTGNVILQLYKSEGGKSENGKSTYAVVQEKKINKDGEVTFGLLQEGKYKFRAILDVNGNGKWDTGLYLKHQQPEEIIYLPTEISVKQNFDIEQEFNLLKTYKEESDKKK
ncbi:MAG: Ig-like domain-containing protein [Odoribacter sp.]